MCYAIFAILIALLFLYSDTIIQDHALTMRVNESGWMTVALGWEMVQILWPVLLLAVVVGSGITYLAPRIIARLRTKPGDR